MLVPPMVGAGLWWKFHRRLVWWEILLPSLVCVVVIFVLRSLVQYGLTRDTEYWTGWATHSEFHEEWVERRVETETYTENGKTKTREVVRYITHPEEYWVYDSNEISIGVDRETYRTLEARWNNSKRHTPFRFSASRNGDIFTTTWDGRRDSMEVVTTAHSFENRVVASENLLDYPEVSDEEVKRYGLYRFPVIRDYYTAPAMLGTFGSGGHQAARLLDEYNALIGKTKQVRMWILVFNDQDRTAGQLQEALWKNGKMNDFVVCIGQREGKVSWAHVFGWTEAHGLKIDVRDAIERQSELDLVKAVEDTKRLVEGQWIRKDFKDFNYLDVPLPGWAVIVIWIVALAASGSMAYWTLHNEFAEPVVEG